MRICVFAGSRQGIHPAYAQAARALADELTNHHIGLIFGGSSLGLMGELARGVLERGGEVIGVLPEQLLAEEAALEGVTELHIVESMSARKNTMCMLADAFISLPGGLGTLDETFEVISLLNVGMSAKPVGLLDVQSFYEPLITFIQRMVTEGFVSPDWSTNIVCSARPRQLVEQLITMHK